MRAYMVTFKQLVSDDDLSKSDDRIDNPSGEYEFDADSEEHALDQFHNSIAVGCLDDFSITCDVVEKPERIAAKERHPIADWRYEVANEDTMRGYEDWLDAKMEQDAEEIPTQAASRKYKVYVTVTEKTFYKPVVVEALSEDNAILMAEAMVANEEVGQQDQTCDYSSEAALCERVC